MTNAPDPSEQSRDAEEERRRRNLATVEAHLVAVSDPVDLDKLLDLVTEDFVTDMPFGERPLKIEGKETFRKFAVRAFEVLAFTLTMKELHPTTDPDVVIGEYDSDGHVVATGERYANSYVGIWSFRDGKIAAHREYADASRSPV